MKLNHVLFVHLNTQHIQLQTWCWPFLYRWYDLL